MQAHERPSSRWLQGLSSDKMNGKMKRKSVTIFP
jgi:hypothetical protein